MSAYFFTDRERYQPAGEGKSWGVYDVATGECVAAMVSDSGDPNELSKLANDMAVLLNQTHNKAMESAGQSRKHSLLEVWANTAVGMVGSYAITVGLLWLYQDSLTPAAMGAITVFWCTVWSLVRGYFIRRTAERWRG